MVEKGVFLVTRPSGFIEHVIVAAATETWARSHASHILGGEVDSYKVTQITKNDSRVIFLVGVN